MGELTTGHDSYGVKGNNYDAATSLLCAMPIGRFGAVTENIVFQTTHVTEHLVKLVSTSDVIEGAIANEIKIGLEGASYTSSFWGRVVVGGQNIEYRAYTLPNGTISVGTYYYKP